MANNIPSLDKLVDCFASLPCVGRKTATRNAYAVLAMDEEHAQEFAQAIVDARKKVHHCPVCHALTDAPLCSICAGERDRSVICVVESPQDINAFEKTREYRGLYHVLHGLISPMDGIEPEHLYIKELLERAASDEVKEIIMATNPTAEGEITAMYISRQLMGKNVKVTRLAYGIPAGGNLEYADNETLTRALKGRSEI